MNSLNSVLIEGNLTANPIEKDGVCTFTIESHRYYKQDDEQQKGVTFIPIETHGRLSETCVEYLKKGRGVRVVGRIKQSNDKLVIYAEHIEFKPILSKQVKQ